MTYVIKLSHRVYNTTQFGPNPPFYFLTWARSATYRREDFLKNIYREVGYRR